MKIIPPDIETRDFQELLAQARTYLPGYTPDWKGSSENDPGAALLKIFLHLQETVIGQLNQMPEKNMIAFLDMLGLKLRPAQPARAWVSFTLTKGAREHVRVPKGTLLSGKGNEQEVIFETQNELLASPSVLQQVFSYTAAEDEIYRHTTDFKNEQQFTLFSGPNIQERCLYLAHENLFNQENPSEIRIYFDFTRPAAGSALLEMVWEYRNKERWMPFAKFENTTKSDPNNSEIDGTNFFTQNGEMVLRKNRIEEIAEYEVNQIKNRWIRCRLLNSLPSNTSVTLPVVNTVRISVNPIEPFPPDLAFNNDIPLNLTEIMTRMLAIEGVGITFNDVIITDDINDVLITDDINEGAESFTFIGAEKLFKENDIIELTNGIDKQTQEDNQSERCKIQTVNTDTIKIDKNLEFSYKIENSKIKLINSRNIALLAYSTNQLVTQDVLKFDNGIDPPEIRTITIPEGNTKVSAENSISRTMLSDELRFEYTPNQVTLYTALKPLAPDIKQTLKVESLAGFDLGQSFRLTLRHLSAKETFNAKFLENSVEELLLQETETETVNNFYIEGDFVRISPKIKPFGELPRLFDTFYVASDDAFSKKGAEIKLILDLEFGNIPSGNTPPDPGQINPVLSWEYWNGKTWRGIRVKDDTDRFLNPGKGNITFTCPEDIEKNEVNGEEKYWIRARIIDGNYGKEFELELISGTNEARLIQGTIYYPIINEIKISYLDVEQQPRHCLSLNSLNYEDHTRSCNNRNLKFEPFQILDETAPGLFLGFHKKLVGGPLRVLFDLEEQSLSEDQRVKINWFYWNGQTWTLINVSDNTKNLTQRDLLEWIGSRDFAESTLFGQKLFWLKGSVVEGTHPESVRINRIHPNSVDALQANVVNNEILGSSNGRGKQTFQMQHPLVISQEIWIREPIMPPEDELNQIQTDETDPVVQEKKNDMGEVIATWVRWLEKDNFDDSHNRSRHYTIDNRLGKIQFGDGNQGMIPPVGANNITATYRYGGGVIGNVSAEAISGLKTTVPFVKTVVNHLAAGGGGESETIDDVLSRGPLKLKHRERAVTVEDFEALAKKASQNVARAKCLSNIDESGEFNPGWITIIIIPRTTDKKPEPDSMLKKTVETYLLQRCITTIAKPDYIYITGPKYCEVTVEATVVVSSADAAATVETNVIQKLSQFINPLTGGHSQEGWEFGETICLSEIYALVGNITGVDYVEQILFRADKILTTGDVLLESDVLPVSGEHIVNLKFGATDNTTQT